MASRALLLLRCSVSLAGDVPCLSDSFDSTKQRCSGSVYCVRCVFPVMPSEMLPLAEAWGQEAHIHIEGTFTIRTDVCVIPFQSVTLKGRRAPCPPVFQFLSLVNRCYVHLLGQGLWPVATDLCLQATTQTANTHTYIHSASGDRTHDPRVQTVEDCISFGPQQQVQRLQIVG